jgi:hypothetical protein
MSVLAPQVVTPAATERGPHRPVVTVPDRPPFSVRRTTTIDTTSPAGFASAMVVDARGRDLVTDGSGGAEVAGEATVLARLERWTRKVGELVCSPPAPELAALLGRSAGAGFRALMRRTVPADSHLLYQLLDDLVGASFVGELPALLVAPPPKPSAGPPRRSAAGDICAGLPSGGVVVEILARGDIPLPAGPPSSSLARPDDAWAWHQTAPLPPNAMRRLRRVDVVATGEIYEVDAHLRDTRTDGSGHETTVHEYALTVAIDGADGMVRMAHADPRVLPWRNCPSAAASAERLVGTGLDDLRTRVARTFTGVSTCTHLNDTLRALADVPQLIQLIPDGVG